MKQNNVIVDKSKAFAIRIINMHKYLNKEKKEFILSKQIMRSGTSIGANVKEASRAFSKPDFYTKMGIALKEASETEYWLELLIETDYITEKAGESLMTDCDELIKLIVAIVKTSKERQL